MLRYFRALLYALSVAVSLCLPASFAAAHSSSSFSAPASSHTVALGDTWDTIAWHYEVSSLDLLDANNTINPHRQPAVDSTIAVPSTNTRNGRLLRPLAGGLLQTAVRSGLNPWTIALQNQSASPYGPLFYTPLFLPGGLEPPRDLPPGLQSLAKSPGNFTPGSAFALRLSANDEIPHIALESQPLLISEQEGALFALGATGAFFPPGQHLLSIESAKEPLWEQPLTFLDRPWTWEEVTFDNPAVLDPEELRRERERLQVLWDQTTPFARWHGRFIPPIEEFVEISSLYGARRSVNGGPYNSYHEGTDFSAYRGSEVTAPAAGKVVLAEDLAIRGGSVILDHGLGLHSGYYHLSAIHVRPGQLVQAGDLLGEVGTTGRSTGNHLHWDLLIGRTWIDPLLWLEQDLAAWISPAPLISDSGGGLKP